MFNLVYTCASNNINVDDELGDLFVTIILFNPCICYIDLMPPRPHVQTVWQPNNANIIKNCQNLGTICKPLIKTTLLELYFLRLKASILVHYRQVIFMLTIFFKTLDLAPAWPKFSATLVFEKFQGFSCHYESMASFTIESQ